MRVDTQLRRGRPGTRRGAPPRLTDAECIGREEERSRYRCSRCERDHGDPEDFYGLKAAEDHLVFMHRIARDLAREWLVVAAHGG